MVFRFHFIIGAALVVAAKVAQITPETNDTAKQVLRRVLVRSESRVASPRLTLLTDTTEQQPEGANEALGSEE